MPEQIHINIGNVLQHKITKSLWRILAFGANRVALAKVYQDGMGKYRVSQDNPRIRHIFWLWLLYKERKDIQFPMWAE